jgi:hypothetical protein
VASRVRCRRDDAERGVSARANVVSGDGRTSSSASGSFSTTGASNSGACRALICAVGVRGSSGEVARMARSTAGALSRRHISSSRPRAHLALLQRLVPREVVPEFQLRLHRLRLVPHRPKAFLALLRGLAHPPRGGAARAEMHTTASARAISNTSRRVVAIKCGIGAFQPPTTNSRLGIRDVLSPNDTIST